MEILFAAAIVGIILMSCIAFYIGKKMGNQGENTEKVLAMESRIKELSQKVTSQEAVIGEQNGKITSLTSERDVQKANADHAAKQADSQRRPPGKMHLLRRDVFAVDELVDGLHILLLALGGTEGHHGRAAVSSIVFPGFIHGDAVLLQQRLEIGRAHV